MSRKSEVQSNFEKPAELYADWSSNDKSFRFYNPESKQNELIDLGKFLFLASRATVKGWSDAEESGIYSNEVKNLSEDELNVRTFSGKKIAEGIYKDIKDKIVNAGAKYVQSIYVMLSDGRIVNLQLKGIALKQWMDFTQKTKSRLPDEWVKVASIGEGKKGSVKFSFPEFEFDGSLNAKQGSQADEAYETLMSRLSPSPRTEEIEEVDADEVDF